MGSDFMRKPGKKEVVLSTGESIKKLTYSNSHVRSNMRSGRAKLILTKEANCPIPQPDRQQMRKIALTFYSLFFFMQETF